MKRKDAAVMLPEWYPQEAILLAWPDDQTDWQPWLSSVQETYRQLIQAITSNQTGVVLLVRPDKVFEAKNVLGNITNVYFLEAQYNDTWCRDYGFITCHLDGTMQPVDFQFNGWGEKFDASLDNLVNRDFLARLCCEPLKHVDTVLEGGAIEIDQSGTLLSTESCLLNPKRNGKFNLHEYSDTFMQCLGAAKVHILKHGHLIGDDTDGHIDTLARFTPNDGIVLQGCENRPDDEHFNDLNTLAAECRDHFPDHQIYSLPLPLVINDNGERLPASYANFLISNQQVLFPTYRQPEDAQALTVIADAFPGYRIVAIDSYPLIQQFGSVHCISMQIPVGTLLFEVTNHFTLLGTG